MSSLTRIAGCAWLALWLAACRQDGGPELELSVVDDRGEGLAEVALRLGGQLVARSDAEGKLLVTSEHLEAGGTLTAECPEAYRPAPPLPLSAPRPRSLQFVCRPRLRTLALVAYAPHAVGSLLRADAQALGRVAADGTLHAVLRRPPGTTVELTLDAALRRTLQVRDRDEIVLLDAER